MPRPHLALLSAACTTLLGCMAGPSGTSPNHVRFTVSFPASIHAEPVTGRMYLMISADSAPEPRLSGNNFIASTPLFGVDVTGLAPGQPVEINDTTASYPVASLSAMPAGDY